MDKLKLEYEMKKNDITAQKMSDILGISKSAFYRKMNQTSDFTRNEMEIIINTLHLEDPMSIFFANEVSHTTQTEG